MTHPLSSLADGASANLDGTSVRVRFIGASGQEIFASLNAPEAEADGGLVICPPLHADFSKHYRTEVDLGRLLARHGIATVRFHYRGTGHSGGDPAALTMTSMVQDARTAIAYLADEGNLDHIAVMGTRLGASVAAAATAVMPGSPLVLWEPVIAASTYLRQAERATLVGDLAQHARHREGDARGHVGASDYVDVHGYPITRALIDSFSESLPRLLGERARPILLLQVGKGSEIRHEYAECQHRWMSQGFDVTTEILRGEVSWWFRGGKVGRDDTNRVASEGCGKVVTWLLDEIRQSGESRQMEGASE